MLFKIFTAHTCSTSFDIIQRSQPRTLRDTAFCNLGKQSGNPIRNKRRVLPLRKYKATAAVGACGACDGVQTLLFSYP
jgi:hypothetical protein